MVKRTCLAALLTLGLAAAETNDARVPVLVELFTSEGCSSCPPADRLLALMDQKQPAPGADLIVLSEHVDYWDRLGWKDPFSSPRFTSRQQEYAEKLHGEGTYTPQMVVDGRFGFVGSDGHEAASAIQKAITDHKFPIAISNVQRDGAKVSAHIDVPANASGLMYIAIADNRAESQVARGENAGQSLAHVAVVRVLKQVGPATSKDVTVTAPSGSRIVAFLQDPRSGRILAVSAQKY